MITRQSDKTLEQSQNFPSTKFGIKETGLSHIFNVLRNQLYSDKILAVIREYSCNAVDAHAEVGLNGRSIEVALPNTLSLYLKIRDYGRGLTNKEIREIYAMYGESTKRGTNEQIGQLGLGCKSAFAYGDNFVINSFVDGKKTSYNAFIDPSEIGQISELSTEKSNEHSGVEIVIPVKQEDCDTFYRKAVDLFKYFQTIPKVTGVDPKKFANDISLGDVVLEGDYWKIHKNKNESGGYNRNSTSDSCVVMGNISYPLDKDALDIVWNAGEDIRVKDDLIDSGVVIRVNIGELDITANRESLEYTKSTKSKIHSYLEDIIAKVPVLMGDKFSACKTLYEAKSLYYKAFRSGGFGDRLEKIAKSKGIVWNGKTIKDAYFRRESFKEGEVNFISYNKPDRWGKGKRVKGEQSKHLICDSDVAFIEDDSPSHVGRLNRIAPLLEEYEGRDKSAKVYSSAILVTFGSDAFKAKWKKDQGFDAQMIKLTSLPKVKLRDIYPSNSSVASTSVKSTKHTSKEFIFNFDYSGHRYDNVRSSYFTEEAIDLNEGGIYIGIDKFFVMDRLTESCELHPYQIGAWKQELEKVGISFPKKVYAFKKAKWDKIEGKQNWKNLFDVLGEKVIEYLEQGDNKQKYIDYTHAHSHCNGKTGRNSRHYGRRKIYDGENEDTAIIQMFQKIKSSNSPCISKIVDDESVFLQYYNAYCEMSGCRKIDKTGDSHYVFSIIYDFCNESFENRLEDKQKTKLCKEWIE